MEYASADEHVETPGHDTAGRQRPGDGLRRQAELLDLAHDAILVRTPEGPITFWNRGAEVLYGWPREAALGKTTNELLRPVYPVEPDRILQELGQANYWEGEMVHTRQDGSVLTVISRWVSRQTEDGRMEILEFNHDISARKRADRADAGFRQLLESVPDSIVVVSREGRIVQVNSQTERLFGYSGEELKGQAIETLLPEWIRDVRVAHRSGYFEDPKARPMGQGLDWNGRRRDGSEFPVEIRLSPLETEEGMQVIGSVRDVSDRRRFERALQEKNVELERALTTKDLFLASMSHELRTPLNAVLGFAGTLLMRLPGPLTPDQERQLRRIQAAGRHLLTLINDVLDLARMESGAIEIERTEISCREVLREVEATMAPIAEVRSLALEVDLPGPSVMIRTHERAFTQIVTTLARHALKYQGQDVLRIGTSAATRDSREMIAVQVAQADGMKAKDQERVQEMLDRVREGRPPDASELGIYLCGRLAALIGGSVEVATEAGSGTRLTLLLPMT
jgi:protein-histidine pros-kinase